MQTMFTDKFIFSTGKVTDITSTAFAKFVLTGVTTNAMLSDHSRRGDSICLPRYGSGAEC